jgi:pyridinium-3,5-bisthiocarboxylic acid mononucleotide nickel chelatase
VIAHLDCSTGVSGDKFLGALLSAASGSDTFAGPQLQAVVAQLAPEARVIVEERSSQGIAGLGIRVEAAAQPTSRTWADIRQALLEAELPARVKKRSVAAFELLAQAEARVHGTTVERVHFHEVGALDSIADVVGTCLGLEVLGVERLYATPVATGWGVVEIAHGVLPVPAPATAALLIGVPVVAGHPQRDGSAPGELTTPTGAALLRTCVDEYAPLPPCIPQAIGYGVGTRDIGTPNICRLVLATPDSSAVTLQQQDVVLLETNLDHLSAEAIAFAAEELMAEGALDVWQTPIVMKKGRLATLLSVLSEESQAALLAERLVALTGTLGVRRTVQPRLVTQRRSLRVETRYGEALVKLGGGGARPEHDDVARIAREHGLGYAEVSDEIRSAADAMSDVSESSSCADCDELA